MVRAPARRAPLCAAGAVAYVTVSLNRVPEGVGQALSLSSCMRGHVALGGRMLETADQTLHRKTTMLQK